MERQRPTARGLEIRLLRRLPALAARLRRRAAGARRARSRSPIFPRPRASLSDGPYDLSLVEGSITTAHDAERIRQVRRTIEVLVTIGACATAGGIQALRNFADVNDFIAAVYASPQYISTLATSTPISAHVPVDYELHGCPINKAQLLEVISAFLAGRKPAIARPQRMRRMQAARHGLRDGAGHALPGPGNPRRLRRDLPIVPPRLLRLLRSDGDSPNTAALARRMAGAWRDATRHCTASSAPSMPRPKPFAKESDAHGD